MGGRDQRLKPEGPKVSTVLVREGRLEAAGKDVSHRAPANVPSIHAASGGRGGGVHM